MYPIISWSNCYACPQLDCLLIGSDFLIQSPHSYICADLSQPFNPFVIRVKLDFIGLNVGNQIKNLNYLKGNVSNKLQNSAIT